MQYTKTKVGYMMRLLKGEEITQTLVAFCKDLQVKSGFFQIIGGVTEVELGYYPLDKKEYVFKKFQETLEIVSATGNIAKVDGKPFAHMHGLFSNENFQVLGGHIKTAVVGATCEIYFVDFETELAREMDKEIGLKLLRCTISL